jgi:hypothetical protein
VADSNQWDVRLSWAETSWKAEEENARRLATRVNLVLTLALASGGIGSKVVFDALGEHRQGAEWMLVVSMVGICFIFVGVAFLLGLKKEEKRQHSFASSALLPTAETQPPTGNKTSEETSDKDKATYLAFVSISLAAIELHGLNALEQKRIDTAQQWLVVGFILTMLFGGAYTWNRESAPAPPVTRVEVVGGAHVQGQESAGQQSTTGKP